MGMGMDEVIERRAVKTLVATVKGEGGGLKKKKVF